MIDAVFVDVSGNRDQVGEHGVAHSGSHLGVSQRIQADIDDAAFADDLHPVKDRSWVIQVGVVGGQQLGGLTGGEFLQQRQ
ncbi:hypothetical protein D9M71_647520 [compost metagenome]